MGNDSSIPSLEKYNESKKLSLEKFQKETPQKMAIHILSNKIEDCIKFVEFFTNKKPNENKELLEKNIEEKINLYSFMNYKIYEDVSELMEEIIKKANYVYNNRKSKNIIYSEVIIILDNAQINDQICVIKTKFEDDSIESSYYIPFLIIISPQTIDLNDFISTKTFHYKFTLDNIYKFFSEKKKEKRTRGKNRKKK